MKGKLSIYYDQEGDYLEIFIKTNAPNYGEEIDKDVTIFKEEKTDEDVGVGILNFKNKIGDLNRMELNLPFEINFSEIPVK